MLKLIEISSHLELPLQNLWKYPVILWKHAFRNIKKKHKKTEIFHEIFHRQKNMFFYISTGGHLEFWFVSILV